jgi:hypothetical protein
MMLSSLPVFWRLQETPAFGSAFIKSVESVAAFCFKGHFDDPRAKQLRSIAGFNRFVSICPIAADQPANKAQTICLRHAGSLLQRRRNSS